MKTFLILSAVAAVTGATAAHAVATPRDIAIANAGFEQQQLEPGGYTNNDLTGWIVSGLPALAGAQRPLPEWMPSVPGGRNMAFLNTFKLHGNITQGIMWQTLGEGVTAGTQYQLSAQIGRRLDVKSLPKFTMELLSGNTVLATGTMTNADVAGGAFSTLKLNYTATADMAAPLTIMFRSVYDEAQGDDCWQAEIDDMRLTATDISAVPEPASWAMMIGGFGAVGGAMRRRVRRPAHAA